MADPRVNPDTGAYRERGPMVVVTWTALTIVVVLLGLLVGRPACAEEEDITSLGPIWTEEDSMNLTITRTGFPFTIAPLCMLEYDAEKPNVLQATCSCDDMWRAFESMDLAQWRTAPSWPRKLELYERACGQTAILPAIPSKRAGESR